MLNLTPKLFSLTIGNTDVTANLYEISNWRTNQPDDTGTCKSTASISLVAGNGFNLDDRTNPLLSVGTPVVLQVADSKGNLVTHPAGRLRIVSAEYDVETRRLNIECGCLITLASVRTPISPVFLGALNGQSTSRFQIVQSLLKKAGIISVVDTSSLQYPINYPIQFSDETSYVEVAGRMLFSAAAFGYIRASDESFVIAPLKFGTSNISSIQIGKDEYKYVRQSNNEGFREVVRVSGSTQVQRLFDSGGNNTVYGDASSVDPSLSGQTIISQTTVTTDWNATSRTLTRTTKTLSPIGLNLPNLPYAFPGFKLQLITSSVVTDTVVYDLDVAGKLRSKTSITLSLAGAVLSEYYNYLIAKKLYVSGADGLIQASTSTITYNYDKKDRLSQISTLTQQPEGALLNGFSLDWKTYLQYYANAPTGLRASAIIEESWTESGLVVWEHKLSTYKSQSLVSPSVIAAKTTIFKQANPNASPNDILDAEVQAAYALVLDQNNSYDDVANDGTTVPSATQRSQPEDYFSPRQIFADYQATYLANPLKPRMRVYSVNYLTGETQAEDDLSLQTAPDPSEPVLFTHGGIEAYSQCYSLAGILSRLLLGNFKGQLVTLTLPTTGVLTNRQV